MINSLLYYGWITKPIQEVTATFSSSALLLTDDKSMGVTQHSYSSSIDCCYGNPVLFPWFESRDVKVVLATIHCPVLVLLLLRLLTPHLEKQFACLRDLGSLKLPLSNSSSISRCHLKNLVISILLRRWYYIGVSGNSGDYLVTLYDTIVGVMWRRVPAQMDGVILFMAHCYGHSQWRGTGHCIKRVKFSVVIIIF